MVGENGRIGLKQEGWKLHKLYNMSTDYMYTLQLPFEVIK